MTNIDFVELRALIARHAERDGTWLPTLPGIIAVSSYFPSPPLSAVAEPLFALVAQGTKHVEIGESGFDCNSGQYLILTVDIPLQARISPASPDAPFLAFAMTLRPDVIASLLLECEANPVGDRKTPGMAMSELTQELVDPVVRLLRLRDQPKDIPALRSGIEREIHWRLLHGPQGEMVRQIGLANSRMAQIGRAIKWIRAHYADSLLVEDAAAIAGMSVTSFHRHFRAITSMSPIQYQKQLRLQAARSRLMAGEDVVQVGFAVGYHSPSQFSREYRRLFGTAPGRDGGDLRRNKINGASRKVRE
jgi:AraC-like DNA-binding protein